MASLRKSKVAAAAGVALVLFASSMMAAAAEEEGSLEKNDICIMCLAYHCSFGYCSALCSKCSGAVGDEQQLRQPDYYCVLCYQKGCPAYCRSGCPRYCGRASSE